MTYVKVFSLFIAPFLLKMTEFLSGSSYNNIYSIRLLNGKVFKSIFEDESTKKRFLWTHLHYARN